jgi:hypothetical protein
MINNLDSEMHMYHPMGEHVPNGSFNGSQTYGFAGPGTLFTQRYREGYRGVNELDNPSMYHDLFYYLYKDEYHRNKADIILANMCRTILAKYPNPIETYDKLTQQLIRDTKTALLIMEGKSMLYNAQTFVGMLH